MMAKRLQSVVRYDAESGQQFTETICPAPKLQKQRWQHKAKGRPFESYTNRSGPSSLLDIALRCLMHNVSEINEEVLRYVPWNLGKRVWDHMQFQYVAWRERIRHG